MVVSHVARSSLLLRPMGHTSLLQKLHMCRTTAAARAAAEHQIQYLQARCSAFACDYFAYLTAYKACLATACRQQFKLHELRRPIAAGALQEGFNRTLKLHALNLPFETRFMKEEPCYPAAEQVSGAWRCKQRTALC